MAQTNTDNDTIYRSLQRHLDCQAVGFPAVRSGADIRLLKILFTPDEARVALHLSYRPTRQDAVIAGAAGQFSAEQTVALLESAFKKGALGWKSRDAVPCWFVMPPVVGIFEAQGDRLSPEFLAAFGAYTRTMEYGKSFISVKPPQMRTIPIKKSVAVEHRIATYDEIRSLVHTSKGPYVALTCICRQSQAMAGKPCKKTSRMETCLAMGDMAAMMLRRGYGRGISFGGALDLLQTNEDEGLVLQPANEQEAEFVCSCCGCCCGMLRYQKMLPRPVDFWAGNFQARIDAASCSGCGVCARRCQVNAVKLKGEKVAAEIDPARCIGCGLCVTTCPKKAITLRKKETETVPPRNEEELLDAIKANRRGTLGQMAMLLKLLLRIRQ